MQLVSTDHVSGGQGHCPKGVRQNASTGRRPETCVRAKGRSVLLTQRQIASVYTNNTPPGSRQACSLDGASMNWIHANTLVCAFKLSFWKTIIAQLFGLWLLLCLPLPSGFPRLTGVLPLVVLLWPVALITTSALPRSSSPSMLTFPSSLLPPLLPML